MKAALIITFLVYLGYLIYKYRNGNLFKFRIVFVASFGLVYLIPFLNQESKQSWFNDDYFLAYILLSLVCSILILEAYFYFKVKRNSYVLTTQFVVNQKWLSPTYKLVIVAYLTQIFFLLEAAGFNIMAVLYNDRVGDYLGNINDFSFIESYLISSLNVLSLFICYTLAKRGKIFKSLSLYLLLILYIFLTTHTRYVLLTYIAIPFIFTHLHLRRFKLHEVFVSIAFAAMYLSIANFYRTGIAQDYALSDLVSTDVILNQIEISSVEDFYSVYNQIEEGQVKLDYGQQYYYYLPLTFIPRSIWADKPFVSYFWRLTHEVTGNYPGPKQFVLTSTFFGEAYHQFGIMGPLLSMLIYVLLFTILLRQVSILEGAAPIIWLIIIHIPMDVRGGLTSIIINFLMYFLVAKFLIKIGFFIKSESKVNDNQQLMF